MSPLDTQLILDELRKLQKLFEKFDARCAKQDDMLESSQGIPIPTQSAAVGAGVVADNWGGLFDGGDHSDEQFCKAPVVADNWGGLFEPVPILEEHVYEPKEGQLAVNAVATEYSSTCDDLTPLEPDEEFATCVTPVPAVSMYPLPKDAIESLTSTPSADEDDYCGSLPTSAPPSPLQVLEPLGIDKSQIHPAEDDDMYLCDALVRSGSVGLILMTDPATFARERLMASVRDYRVHGDPAYIIAFKIDPCIAVSERAYAIHAFRRGPIECALRATALGGYDGSLDDDLESGVAHFDEPHDRAIGHVGQAPSSAATICTDALGAAGGGLLAGVVAVGSAPATCSMICQAYDRSFIDVPVAAFWEEKPHWNDDSGTIPVDALACLMRVALARHGEASSLLLLWAHGTVHAHVASVLDDPITAFLAKLHGGTSTTVRPDSLDAAVHRAKHLHGNNFTSELGREEADLDMKLMGSRYWSSNQSVIEYKAYLDARLMVEEMTRQNSHVGPPTIG